MKKSWDETLEEFAYLWKMDDSDWVAQRKQEWRTLAKGAFSDCSAKEVKKYGQYYVAGVNVRGENSLLPDRLAYITPVVRFFLTPFDSGVSMKGFFNNQSYGLEEKAEILSSYPWYLSDKGEGLPWVFPDLQFFSENLLGHEYKLFEGYKSGGVRKAVYSPNPTSWCGHYHHRAKDSIRGKRDSEKACIEMIDYFVSALKYVKREGKVSMDSRHLESLIDEVNRALSFSSLEGDKLQLAQLLKKREGEIRSNWEKAEPFDIRFM